MGKPTVTGSRHAHEPHRCQTSPHCAPGLDQIGLGQLDDVGRDAFQHERTVSHRGRTARRPPRSARERAIVPDPRRRRPVPWIAHSHVRELPRVIGADHAPPLSMSLQDGSPRLLVGERCALAHVVRSTVNWPGQPLPDTATASPCRGRRPDDWIASVVAPCLGVPAQKIPMSQGHLLRRDPDDAERASVTPAMSHGLPITTHGPRSAATRPSEPRGARRGVAGACAGQEPCAIPGDDRGGE